MQVTKEQIEEYVKIFYPEARTWRRGIDCITVDTCSPSNCFYYTVYLVALSTIAAYFKNRKQCLPKSFKRKKSSKLPSGQ